MHWVSAMFTFLPFLSGCARWRAPRGSAVILVLGACVRPPAERLCPPLQEGELVITELRGKGAAGADGLPWLELRNASGRELDLQGLRLRFRRLDGGAELGALVRRAVALSPEGRAVLSLAEDEARPAFAAYGLGEEISEPWFAAAAVQVESCEVLVDRVLHPPLPETGTYALGEPWPAAELATRNDLPAAWCVDPAGTPSAPGTPGQENPPCR